MKIICGCEESQVVTKAFRALGHEAYSCDLIDSSGGRHRWHLQMDVFDAIKLNDWDMGLFFPDCTYLTISANGWYKDQPARKSGALVGHERMEAREKAIQFFMKLWNCKIPKIAIENPIGVMSTVFRKPDQIIQPYNFGDDASKQTCLWLKGLPKLVNTVYCPPRIVNGKKRWGNQCDNFGHEKSSPSAERAKNRSKTFPGIGAAMASQWSNLPTP
jgi:hypothetical protein